jgi:hypothetical protein
MVEAAETLEAKLKRHEDALIACMAEIEKLRAENALLRSAEGAHDVLRRIYLNESESSNARIKAAQASINFEKSRLENVPPPLDLVAEQHESLADIVTRQRARCRAIQALPLEQRAAMISGVAPGDGNGRDDDTAS